MHKITLAVLAMLYIAQASAQTCFSITNRTNGNGNPGTCGSPNCSGNAKTGHIDVSFGAACPGVIPTLQLMSVTSGTLPTPFCFDPGNCISPGTVRYCFRGNNLPSSGFMTVRLTQGASVWSCHYDVTGGSGMLLPVKFISFDARLQEQKVLLKWETEQELNNKSFEVERSEDNRNFKSIGSLSGAGSTTIIQKYSFVDQQPPNGISFYRLRQVDIDGRSNFSSIVRVDNRLKGLQVKQIFPNPATDLVNLELEAEHSMMLQVRIINPSGMQLISFTKSVLRGNHSLKIDLPSLARGIYQIAITSSNGSTITERLLVN